MYLGALVVYMFVYQVCAWCADAIKGQMSWDWSYSMWATMRVLGVEFGSSGEASNVLNCQAISPACFCFNDSPHHVFQEILVFRKCGLSVLWPVFKERGRLWLEMLYIPNILEVSTFLWQKTAKTLWLKGDLFRNGSLWVWVTSDQDPAFSLMTHLRRQGAWICHLAQFKTQIISFNPQTAFRGILYYFHFQMSKLCLRKDKQIALISANNWQARSLCLATKFTAVGLSDTLPL